MPPAPGPRAGDPVRVVMTKWAADGRRPHWEYDAVLLGSDAHGDWVGVPAGTPMARPGARYVAPTDQVVLAPAAAAPVRGWLATFHAPGGPVSVYVDVATPPAWDGTVLRAVDLDLDVVRGTTGRVWVDDEDEFARHRAQHGYPDDVVRAALAARDHLLAALEAAAPPFDPGAPGRPGRPGRPGTAARWLARL